VSLAGGIGPHAGAGLHLSWDWNNCIGNCQQGRAAALGRLSLAWWYSGYGTGVSRLAGGASGLAPIIGPRAYCNWLRQCAFTGAGQCSPARAGARLPGGGVHRLIGGQRRSATSGLNSAVAALAGGRGLSVCWRTKAQGLQSGRAAFSHPTATAQAYV